MSRFGIDYAKAASGLIYGLVFVITLTVVLGQLQIETELLNATVKILVFGIALTLALALGLGLRNTAHQIVSGVYARDVFKEGAELEIDGKPAILVSIGAVSTRLEGPDGTFLVIPNGKLVGSVVTGKDPKFGF